MWHREVSRLGRHRRIILGLLFLPGLRICFPLFLLALWLQHSVPSRVHDAAVTRRSVVLIWTLHPVLIVGESSYPLGRHPSRLSKLIRQLGRYNVLRVQEAARVKWVGPRAVQLGLTLSRRTLREGLSSELGVVLVRLVEIG